MLVWKSWIVSKRQHDLQNELVFLPEIGDRKKNANEIWIVSDECEFFKQAHKNVNIIP